MKSTTKYCFYCNGVVTESSSKGDHFPLPKRNGGFDTIPICTSCHDMKDRISFDRWNPDWIAHVISDMQYVSRETKLFFAKSLSLISDAIEQKKGEIK